MEKIMNRKIIIIIIFLVMNIGFFTCNAMHYNQAEFNQDLKRIVSTSDILTLQLNFFIEKYGQNNNYDVAQEVVAQQIVASILKKISNSEIINNSTNTLLKNCCKKIKCIKFSQHLAHVTDEALMAFCQESLPLIEKISLAGCRFLTDVSMQRLTQCCPNITHLSLVNCHNITDQTIQALTACKKLKTLNLTNCYRLTNVSILKQLVDVCNNLHALYLCNTGYDLQEVLRVILKETK